MSLLFERHINRSSHDYDNMISPVGFKVETFACLNPLPHIPISVSSNSTTNKNMMSKIWTMG